MAKNVVGFKRETARKIMEHIGGSTPTGPTKFPQSGIFYPRAYLARGLVTAPSGLTPGEGLVDIYWRDKTTGKIARLQDAAGNNRTMTVYNFAPAPIGTTNFIWIQQDMSGDFWVTAEGCA